jgi:hypothetical protein
MRVVDRRRHGNDDEIRRRQERRITADFEMNRGLEIGGAHLTGRIDGGCRYCAILLADRSKPMVRRFLPNSTASGKPT